MALEMGNLKSLKNLYLTGNQLTSVPEWIGNLQHLEVLYLQNNQLKFLPEEPRQGREPRTLHPLGCNGPGDRKSL